MVINGEAGGQIMGDWAQGEFQVANKVAGNDYTCLPGLGLNAGDRHRRRRLLLPEGRRCRGERRRRKCWPRRMLSPTAQVAFNLKKGSLPVRGDVDLTAANDCMKKGLEILAAGNTVQWTDELISPDTVQQMNDLMAEFFSTPTITAEDAQKRFAEIIGAAD